MPQKANKKQHIVRSFADLPSGTTTEQMPPVEVNLQAGAINLLPEIETVISPSETNSEKTKPKPSLRRIPQINLTNTPCCGLNIVSGFQQVYESPGDIILSMARNHRLNSACSQRVADERRKYDTLYDKSQGMYNPPHDGFISGPHRITGMVVFVWNHQKWLQQAKDFADFVAKNGIGECFFTGEAHNTNSGNRITAMTWCVNNSGYYKFLANKEVPE